MKNNRFMFMLLSLLLFIVIFPVAAEERGVDDTPPPSVSTDPAPEPIIVNGEEFINDPRINDDANACYEDGTLAGRCDTSDVDGDGDIDDDDRAWIWAAGWHLIRWEYGLVSREQVDFFASILPPEILPSGGSGGVPPGCYKAWENSVTAAFVLWPGGGFTQVDRFNDAACTDPNGTMGVGPTVQSVIDDGCPPDAVIPLAGAPLYRCD